MRLFNFCVSTCAAVLFVIASVHAAPITLTRSGTASGTIDGFGFTDADFVITSLGDTDNVASLGGGLESLDHNSSTIVIDGVGSFDFVTVTRTFAFNDGSVVTTGFGRGLAAGAFAGADLFTGPFGIPGSWDLTSSLGPLSGFGFVQQWALADVLTSGGVLFMDSGSSQTTFEAVVMAVPAPGALALLGIGLLGLGLYRRVA